MSRECEKMPDCPFFKKFPRHAASYKYIYCEGPRMESCVRLFYTEKNGTKPPDELAPTGVLVDNEE